MMVGQENPVTLVMEWIGCLCAPPVGGVFRCVRVIMSQPSDFN